MSSFILVHSPLVGPVTWTWVAEELRRGGNRVIVPSLKHAAVSGRWEGCVDAAVRDARGEIGLLVGHSGAGPLLPAIANRMDQPPRRLVFVDAAVPPVSGDAPLVPEEFLDSVRALAKNGRLPRWSEWFGPTALEELVPDPDRRAAVLADLPQLPLSYFDGRVPIPRDWASTAAAYVLLSDPYRSDAAEAASRGWPVKELPGAHLDIVTRPSHLSETLIELAV